MAPCRDRRNGGTAAGGAGCRERAQHRSASGSVSPEQRRRSARNASLARRAGVLVSAQGEKPSLGC
jgi:hypothetical protein